MTSFVCTNCRQPASFVAIHGQDLYERSQRGPCCLATSVADIDPHGLDDMRLIGGSQEEPVRLTIAAALDLITAFWTPAKPATPTPVTPVPGVAPAPTPVVPAPIPALAKETTSAKDITPASASTGASS